MAKKPSAKKSPAAKKVPAAKKRVLVVDDHPVFRAGLISLVHQEPDLIVCGEANDAAHTIPAIDRLHPDIVLMDMGLPDKNGLELLKDVRATHPDLPVLIISMHDETLYAERVLRAGGRGYIMKQTDPDRIIQAIRKVLGGGTYVSERTASLIIDNISGKRASDTGALISRLTDREFEILRLMGDGKEAHDIAGHLHLSTKTVDTHRAHIRKKLGMKNSTELIHYATRWVNWQQ